MLYYFILSHLLLIPGLNALRAVKAYSGPSKPLRAYCEFVKLEKCTQFRRSRVSYFRNFDNTKLLKDGIMVKDLGL